MAPSAPEDHTPLVERTLELVRIASPSGNERELADHVERFLREETTPAYLRRHGDAIVVIYGAEPAGLAHARRTILLGGHLDTVPHAGHPVPTVENDQVIGLGSTDMKGGLAVMMELAKTQTATANAPLAMIFYDCEEVEFAKNGLKKIFELEPWIEQVDLALMLEPTDNALELGCMGSIHAKVVFHGVAAHSARPWTGSNAIHKAGALLQKLATTPPREHQDGPAVYREVLSATLARGGEKRTVIPERFELNLNLRFPPDRTLAEAEGYLRSFLPDEVTVEITDVAPAAPARMDSPLLLDLAERFELPARGKQAWTDVAQFAQHGVAAANFGPGLPVLAHKQDERVPTANLSRCYAILNAFLMDPEAEGED